MKNQRFPTAEIEAPKEIPTGEPRPAFASAVFVQYDIRIPYHPRSLKRLLISNPGTSPDSPHQQASIGSRERLEDHPRIGRHSIAQQLVAPAYKQILCYQLLPNATTPKFLTWPYLSCYVLASAGTAAWTILYAFCMQDAALEYI